TKSTTINVYPDGSDTTVRDSVKSTSTCARPDLLIKKESEADTAYAINDTYQTTPSGNQIEPQTVNVNATATYRAKVENDGPDARTYVLKATESVETGWSISYWVGATEITSSITGAGYTTSSLGAGGSAIVKIEMTPGASAVGSTTKTAMV
ncbi:MAG: hypothetical protein COS85_01585, partial [Armatimonadetes bacterium CG07_land_8_20_14_0_80_59_28]